MEWILVALLNPSGLEMHWDLKSKKDCEEKYEELVAEKGKQGFPFYYKKDHKCFAVNEEGGYE